MAALEQGTWVIIADGEKALVMENITDAQDPNLVVVSVEEQDAGPSKPTDRAGRRPDTGPNQKSAVEEDNWKAHAKSLFVQDVANLLNRKGLKGAYKRLVLVASPQVLGLLRRRLHSEVLAKVVAEVDKTLTNHPLHKVERILRNRLAKPA
ncbi:Protein required for attachment to host cells [Ruegeria halocynthiae]|uniref:Protein required for attachment to host cells n=1 Tax=Ruegeria halocynthiae TaxID=985054 RepID=A0A1H2S0Y5_9RHOB|nr:host attachment family protein [Ruegeria halocynthiae]SDW25273.1 Protein required for attachment to host cells [Ruegeria halocynthiae]